VKNAAAYVMVKILLDYSSRNMHIILVTKILFTEERMFTLKRLD